MKKMLFLFAVLILVSGCVVQKVVSDKTEASVVATGGDGSSFEKAIIINEKREKPGIDAEYTWIYKNYPGSKVTQQMLTEKKGVPYDILKIVTAGGEEKSIYFNISKFFGKF